MKCNIEIAYTDGVTSKVKNVNVTHLDSERFVYNKDGKRCIVPICNVYHISMDEPDED